MYQLPLVALKSERWFLSYNETQLSHFMFCTEIEFCFFLSDIWFMTHFKQSRGSNIFTPMLKIDYCFHYIHINCVIFKLNFQQIRLHSLQRLYVKTIPTLIQELQRRTPTNQFIECFKTASFFKAVVLLIIWHLPAYSTEQWE